MSSAIPSNGMIQITDKEFVTLTGYIKQKYGVNLEKKRVLIEGRMTNMLRERGFTTFQQYLDFLFQDQSGKEITNLLNRLTTNYSYFMREPEHYVFMREIALPELARRHQHDRDLRIWSAGCSAGQEAYTTAMVIDEFFGHEKSRWDATILATDISMNVLEKAQQGIYPADNLKDISPAWKQKYFVQISADSYQVSQKIRDQVVFKPLNLMEPFRHKKPMDLIFCRNVMIYFDTQTKDQLVERYYQATAEGGYLFIGHSESINREASAYRYLKPAIYQKGGTV